MISANRNKMPQKETKALSTEVERRSGIEVVDKVLQLLKWDHCPFSHNSLYHMRKELTTNLLFLSYYS